MSNGLACLQFEDWTPHRKTRDRLEAVNAVIGEYEAQGYRLTLRQLYYQLVSRNIIENLQREYDKLGVMLANARKAGQVSWDAIEDRTRNLVGLARGIIPGVGIAAHPRRLPRKPLADATARG